MSAVPTHWYNIVPDLGFELPRDLPSPEALPGSTRTMIPMALIRQELSPQRRLAIPDAVLQEYRRWRPSPLRRARALEEATGTGCRLYYKYEGGNVSGSHKLNTAIAQAYYYRDAGATTLTVGTGAGQWGTAVAAACQALGLGCRVYMVRTSYESKPYRRTLMETLGAEVFPSPSGRTDVGRRVAADPAEASGSLSVALAEAVADTTEPGTAFCTGSGETYSLLHQTVIGLEAQEQLQELGEQPDLVVGSLGGGSNFGGLALPFVGKGLREGTASPVCLSVEPQACPKLTRGVYAYDYTDASRSTPLQKMYTLGHRFRPPGIHAGGLRYHATAKLVSALYHRGLIEAVAYAQRQVFASGQLFARAEGILPAPESAHAVHGALEAAREADAQGESRSILIGVSGHGLLDLAAYQAYLDGDMVDVEVSETAINEALSQLPAPTVRGSVVAG